MRESRLLLNNIIQNSQFKKKVSLEEQKAQKEYRFYEEDRSLSWSTTTFEWLALMIQYLNKADLFSVALRDGNFQEFDTRCDEVLPALSKIPLDDILESQEICRAEGKATGRIHMVPEGDSRGNKQPQDQTMYGHMCGSICLMQRKAKQSKNGLSRNRSSIMPEDYVVSSTLVESWKFRCQQQCLVQYQQIAAVKPAATLGNARPNMFVLSMPTNLWGSDWKVCHTGITKITLLQKE